MKSEDKTTRIEKRQSQITNKIPRRSLCLLREETRGKQRNQSDESKIAKFQEKWFLVE